MMAAIANGGSADDIAPGVDFFGELKEAGNFLPVDPDSATIESGQTPVVIDWDYLGAAAAKNVSTWKTVVPEEAVVAGYYFQAINADAPHPAAARLWQEFLYSDEGQNLWLKGGARPVRGDAMAEAGTIDQALWDALPEVGGEPVIPTNEQTEKAAAYLAENWSKVDQLNVAVTEVTTPAPVAGTPPAPGVGPKIAVGSYVPLLPFFGFLLIFLIVPTVTVVVSAFQDGEGGFTLGNVRALTSDAAVNALWNSIILSGSTAIIGAVFGGLLSYLILTLGPRSVIRRTAVSVCGVLAQFGGVTLAFAFISLLGFSGVLTEALRSWPGIDIWGSGWLFGLPGLIVVYCYFQIPLMVIVFTPALEGLRPQWREAATNLGATTPQYWRMVGFPLLTPAFLGSMLLLFANAFAAYATAAVLVSQGNPISPLFIRSALTSEVLLGQRNLGFALALQMVVVVAIVMGLYALLLRRTARWLR